jgi:hypothetical protein
MDNWLANIASDVDSLHVEIDNLNDLLVGFYFIRSIDVESCKIWDLLIGWHTRWKSSIANELHSILVTPTEDFTSCLHSIRWQHFIFKSTVSLDECFEKASLYICHLKLHGHLEQIYVTKKITIQSHIYQNLLDHLILVDFFSLCGHSALGDCIVRVLFPRHIWSLEKKN